MSNGRECIMDDGDLTAVELGEFEIIPGAMKGEQPIRPISAGILSGILVEET